mmetsp:Transcript_824/g.2998  ORF Transcript_824/g.2998 Transcript_824/m.2998 type:complete len:463 (+) Transcript_824:93-1481(+)
MRHQHVVEVVAVFEDPQTKTFCIQMPWAVNGHLAEWVAGSSPRRVDVLRVLTNVLSALDHLHTHSIVHSDVKPMNVLVDAAGRGALADFDVSVDRATRTSVAYRREASTRARTVVGFTPGFDAPEMQRTGATKETDMYAFGAMMREVLGEDVSGDEAQLIRALMSEAPAERPSAGAALRHAAFAPVVRWQAQERRECCICADNLPLEEGAECGLADGSAHFVCSECMAAHVTSELDQELTVRQARDGRILCPGCRAEDPNRVCPYTDAILAALLPASTFANYMTGRLAVSEQRLRQELDGEYREQMEGELVRLRALSEDQARVLQARKHIEERILTCSCPGCGGAFLDFAGCFALKCHKCHPTCFFCGFCGGRFASDQETHRHCGFDGASSCPSKPDDVDIFGYRRNAQNQDPARVFEEAQNRRRRRELTEYLQTLGEGVRREVKAQIRNALAELGLQDLVD